MRTTMLGTPRRLRLTTAALACLPALLVAGCGGDGDGETPDAGGSPSEQPALWNPCDGLDRALVDRAMGTRTQEQAGTATDPDCRFTPVKTGGPVLESGYALFDAGLEDAWRTMGDFEGAQVSTPDVPGSDDARVVVRTDGDQLYVSGFVQNGDLIQTTNVVDPAPFDRTALVAGTVAVLGALSTHANDANAADAG